MIQVEHAKVIERHLSVPPSKNVHIVLIYHCCVAEPDLRLGQKLERLWDDSLVHHALVLFRVHFYLFTLDVEPTVRADVITVKVREDVGFVAATIHIELVEVSDEGVVGSRLGCVSWIQIDPLLLDGLKFCQIIEVDTTFACVPTKEEYAVLKGKTVCARPRGWLL